jgi:hypothetical protein
MFEAFFFWSTGFPLKKEIARQLIDPEAQIDQIQKKKLHALPQVEGSNQSLLAYLRQTKIFDLFGPQLEMNRLPQGTTESMYRRSSDMQDLS